MKVAEVGALECFTIDPAELSFRNINTPEEYFNLRDGGRVVRRKTAVHHAEQSCKA